MRRISRTPEQQRLVGVIQEARELNTYPDVAWEAWRWEILQYERNRRAHDREPRSLLFTRRKAEQSDRAVPFASPYDDFAKAVIRMRASLPAVGASSQMMMILALRFLYEALQRSRLSDPTHLVRRHFHLAMEDMRRACTTQSAYSLGIHLSEIATFLNTHRLTRTRIHFHNPMACPLKGDHLDPASQAGLKKMPSRETLEALAAISSDPLNDNERVLLRIIDLLVVGGFRVGEALTLPRDCWVEEPALDASGRPKMKPGTGDPVKRCGLRYWPEKGGEPTVKWLPDCSVPLARRAVDDLTRLGEEARKAAKVLEQNPDRVPLPGGLHPDQLLSIQELTEILPLRRKASVWRFLATNLKVQPAKRVKLRKPGRPLPLYRVRDIEVALLKRRGQLEVVHTFGGKAQMLSESLCVAFQNQFDSTQATFPFLAELVSYKQISSALGGKPRSVFSRHGVAGRDGAPLKIRTHAFRHWLNTLADQGGLSDVELACWMGRLDIRQNQAYKHGTVQQRAAWAQEMLKGGKLHGPTTRVYEAIHDPVDKEKFLQTFVSVAHFTPYGVCTHDFALTPCPYHLNCLAGCVEYLRTRGDAEERQNLIQLRTFTVMELKKAEQAVAKRSQGTGNWVEFNRRTLAGIDAALAVDEEEPRPGRGVSAVFPTGKSLGKPIG